MNISYNIFLLCRTKINVIVIDNIASLASEIVENNDVKNLFERGIFLKQLSTSLKTMAYKYDIAVIIINNVIASFSDEYKKSKQVNVFLSLEEY